MNNQIHKSKSKALLAGTLVYAIGTFGTKVISFLIVPLYTYYIAPAELGYYDLIITTVNLLTPFITMQISDGAYAWMIKNIDKSKDYITAVYKFIICCTILGAGIILGINEFVKINYAYYFVVILITGRWMQSLQKLLRGLKNQKLFAASGLLYTICFLLLNLLQVVVLKQGVHALFQSMIIANIITIIVILAAEKRLRQIDFKDKSFPLQKEMLKFSIPLVPNRLNWWIINSSDRYIIRYFLGSTANGIYAVAYKFPGLLKIVFDIFYESWQDNTIGDKDEDEGKFYSTVFRYYYRFAFTLLLFVIPFTKVFIDLVMSEAYREASLYISFLYLGTVFQAFSSFLGVGYIKNNKTIQAATTSIYGAVVNGVINLILIKIIGLHAASVSTFVGFFVMYVVRAWQTRNTLKIKVEWKWFVLLFMMSLMMTIITIFTNFKMDVILFLCGVLLFALINAKDMRFMFGKVLKKVRH